jgi:hypothetical protein
MPFKPLEKILVSELCALAAKRAGDVSRARRAMVERIVDIEKECVKILYQSADRIAQKPFKLGDQVQGIRNQLIFNP